MLVGNRPTKIRVRACAAASTDITCRDTHDDIASGSSKAIKVINTQINYHQKDFASLQKMIALSLRLSPSDPIYEVQRIVIASGSPDHVGAEMTPDVCTISLAQSKDVLVLDVFVTNAVSTDDGPGLANPTKRPSSRSRPSKLSANNENVSLQSNIASASAVRLSGTPNKARPVIALADSGQTPVLSSSRGGPSSSPARIGRTQARSKTPLSAPLRRTGTPSRTEATSIVQAMKCGNVGSGQVSIGQGAPQISDFSQTSSASPALPPAPLLPTTDPAKSPGVNSSLDDLDQDDSSDDIDDGASSSVSGGKVMSRIPFSASADFGDQDQGGRDEEPKQATIGNALTSSATPGKSTKRTPCKRKSSTS
jgi:hypothetical protein